MAIHAKSNGLLIGGKIVGETDKHWIFQARDNKRPNVVSKSDTKNRVFDGEQAAEEAINWQDAVNPRIKANKALKH